MDKRPVLLLLLLTLGSGGYDLELGTSKTPKFHNLIAGIQVAFVYIKVDWIEAEEFAPVNGLIIPPVMIVSKCVNPSSGDVFADLLDTVAVDCMDKLIFHVGRIRAMALSSRLILISAKHWIYEPMMFCLIMRHCVFDQMRYTYDKPFPYPIPRGNTYILMIPTTRDLDFYLSWEYRDCARFLTHIAILHLPPSSSDIEVCNWREGYKSIQHVVCVTIKTCDYDPSLTFSEEYGRVVSRVIYIFVGAHHMKSLRDSRRFKWKKEAILNPFREMGKGEIQEWTEIAATIIQRSNLTYMTEYRMEDIGDFVMYDVSVIILDKDTTIYEKHLWRTSLDVLYVHTGSSGLRFITCYSDPMLSFHLYTSAYDGKTWMLLLCTCLALTIIVHCYICYHQIKVSTSTIFMVIGTLTEESVYIPSKLDTPTMRMILGIWWLLSTVLTNGFSCIVIDKVILPLQGDPIDKFSSITCQYYGQADFLPEKAEVMTVMEELRWRIYSSSILFSKPFRDWVAEWTQFYQWENRTDHKYNRRVAEVQKSCFSILNQVSEISRDKYSDLTTVKFVIPTEALDEYYWPFGAARDKEHERVLAYGSVLSQKAIGTMSDTYWHLSNPSNRYEPKTLPHGGRLPLYSELTEFSFDWIVEKEVVSCGKSAWVLPGWRLPGELRYLKKNYPRKNFQASVEEVDVTEHKWGFIQVGSTPIIKYFVRIFESGIYQELLGFSQVLVPKLRTDETAKNAKRISMFEDKGRGMTMQGSVQTVFILGVGVVWSAVSAFLLEHWWLRRSLIGDAILDRPYAILGKMMARFLNWWLPSRWEKGSADDETAVTFYEGDYSFYNQSDGVRQRFVRVQQAADVPKIHISCPDDTGHRTFEWIPKNFGNASKHAFFTLQVGTCGGKIYVIRAGHCGQIVPGMLLEGDSYALISHCGSEVKKEHYEVLAARTETLSWVEFVQDADIFTHAIVGGVGPRESVFFIGRVITKGGRVVVGKVDPRFGTCRVPFNGVEQEFRDFEVLVNNPLGRALMNSGD